jgi:hypothetical protein
MQFYSKPNNKLKIFRISKSINQFITYSPFYPIPKLFLLPPINKTIKNIK